MLGIALDQGFDEGGFADAWRSNDRNDYGRSLFREAVNEGHVEALFFDLTLCERSVV